MRNRYNHRSHTDRRYQSNVERLKRELDCPGPVPRYKVAPHPDCQRAPIPVAITHEALNDLLVTVGRLPPESGAKCFGPKDRFGIDVVEFDVGGSAVAAGSVYSPDVVWGEQRCHFHLHQPDDRMRLWTADVHSHPGHYGRPSPKVGDGLGDLGYVEKVFELNPALLWFPIPILTRTATEEVWIHTWICHRDAPHKPLIADLWVCDADEFPEREFNPTWLASLATPATDCDEVFGPEVDAAEPEVAAVEAEPEAATVDAAREAMRREYRARLTGLISEAFHDKTIAVVGVGAGSLMVEKLARLMPRCIKMCDFDIVELHNLTRTAYTFHDALGKTLKVQALAERVRAINPLVEPVPVARNLLEMTEAERDALFDGADLVVAGTDQFEAQALVNREAVARGIPALFIGIHARGEGGRVIWTVPERTGCYRCAAGHRYEAAARREAGEGEVNLEGAIGSLVDCQFIDIIALKVLVALLERGEDSQMARFGAGLEAKDVNEVIVRCSPEYAWGNAMWDAVLADLPREPKDYAAELQRSVLFAMDTLWTETSRDDACPDCGGTCTPVEPPDAEEAQAEPDEAEPSGDEQDAESDSGPSESPDAAEDESVGDAEEAGEDDSADENNEEEQTS